MQDGAGFQAGSRPLFHPRSGQWWQMRVCRGLRGARIVAFLGNPAATDTPRSSRVMSLPEPTTAPPARRRASFSRLRISRVPLRAPAAGAWRTALREFAVIVAGVLAALAAQAWWESRQERDRERDYLVHLLADTRENEARLEAAVALDSAAVEAAARLGRALYGTGPLPSADTMAAGFMGGAFSSSDFRPLTGTYTALQAAGDLRLIRTDSLRAEIVAYGATLEYGRSMLQFFLQQGFGDAGRVARALPFLRGIFSMDGDSVRAQAARFPFEQLRQDPDAASALFAAQAAATNRLTHLRGLRDESRALRAMLEAERALRSARGRSSSRAP